MSNPELTAQLVQLMSRRTSNRGGVVVEATPELAEELNRVVLPKIPSAGDLRTLLFGLGVNGRLQIISSPSGNVTQRYGADIGRRLLDMEAGTLAAYANLYLLSKGYQVRYVFTNTPDGQNVRLLLTLELTKDA
jgi:hypothetical protein